MNPAGAKYDGVHKSKCWGHRSNFCGLVPKVQGRRPNAQGLKMNPVRAKVMGYTSQNAGDTGPTSVVFFVGSKMDHVSIEFDEVPPLRGS